MRVGQNKRTGSRLKRRAAPAAVIDGEEGRFSEPLSMPRILRRRGFAWLRGGLHREVFRRVLRAVRNRDWSLRIGIGASEKFISAERDTENGPCRPAETKA